jgi:hypothetical protein
MALIFQSPRYSFTRSFYSHIWSQHCFNELRFADCDLNATLDSHPYGPNQQYLAIYHSPLFEEMRRDTDYFFLMEPDTFPIRANWMVTLLRETTGDMHGQWWGKGAMYEGDLQLGVLDFRLHINGNGLWSTAMEMGHYSIKMYDDPWCPGWDHELFCYMTHSPHLYRDVMHRWRYSKYIMNMWHINWNTADARQRYPTTTFIHGKQRDGITKSE